MDLCDANSTREPDFLLACNSTLSGKLLISYCVQFDQYEAFSIQKLWNDCTLSRLSFRLSKHAHISSTSYSLPDKEL